MNYLKGLRSAQLKNNDEDRNKNIDRIIIIRFDGLGDFVWTTPLIRELRIAYPNATIDIVVKPFIAELLRNCDYVNNVFPFLPQKYQQETIYEFIEIQKEIEHFIDNNPLLQSKYDVAILPRTFSIKDTVENYIFATALQCTRIIGTFRITNSYSAIHYELIKGLYDYISLGDTKLHEVEMITNTLKFLCLNSHPDNHMELWPQKNNANFSNMYDGKKYVLIGLAGSTPNRNWKIENYRELMQQISNYSEEYYFILCGEKQKESDAKFLKESLGERCINYVGSTTLQDVVDIADKCMLYIGSDTGLLHVAAALEKPVIEISAYIKGGTYLDDGGNPRICGPWKTNAIILQPNKGVDGCEDQCMMNYSHCINLITVNDVFMAFKNIVDNF